MTNVFASPEKVAMKTQLFDAGVKALEGAGWKVERVQGSGKSSVRPASWAAGCSSTRIALTGL